MDEFNKKVKEIRNQLFPDNIMAARACQDVLEAYGDCFFTGESTRNLRFFCNHPFWIDEAESILSKAIPDGYNEFSSKLFKNFSGCFGIRTQVFIGRENSVCLYGKPCMGLDFSSERNCFECLCADEFSYDPHLGLFRL